MAEDNVVKMPDRLERRAQRIEAAMKRRESSDRDWIEGTLELGAVELASSARRPWRRRHPVWRVAARECRRQSPF